MSETQNDIYARELELDADSWGDAGFPADDPHVQHRIDALRAGANALRQQSVTLERHRMSDLREQLEQMAAEPSPYSSCRQQWRIAHKAPLATLDAVEAALRRLPSAAEHDDRFRAGWYTALAFVQDTTQRLRSSLTGTQEGSADARSASVVLPQVSEGGQGGAPAAGDPQGLQVQSAEASGGHARDLVAVPTFSAEEKDDEDSGNVQRT